jgi:hypothetical protein
MPKHVTFREDGITLVNGRPFFLVGARHMPEGATPPLLAEVGFNAYRHVAFSHEVMAASPPPQEDEGLYFWSYLGFRTCLAKSPSYRSELERHIAAVREHPALLCYENLNEAATLWKNRPPKAMPDEMQEGTALLRQLDPHHPIWLTHSCERTVETLASYNPHGDMVGCNPYPIVPAGIRPHVGFRPDGRFLDCPDQTLHAVGRYTHKMRQVGGTMPVCMLIQAMANENWFHPEHTPEFAAEGVDAGKILYPTRHELRFMVFDAIIASATGLALALWKTPVESQMWHDVVAVVRELRQLEPALTGELIVEPFTVRYTDLGFTIWDGVVMLARRVGDETYLFTANTAFDPAQVTISLPKNLVAQSCAVWGEQRTIPLSNHSLEDRFEPYDVHIYRLRP